MTEFDGLVSKRNRKKCANLNDSENAIGNFTQTVRMWTTEAGGNSTVKNGEAWSYIN